MSESGSFVQILMKMNPRIKRIWLVEPDDLQLYPLMEFLKELFPDAVIIPCTTELLFRQLLEYMMILPPNLVITEMMLPWQRFGEIPIGRPFLGDREGYLAGYRCLQLLAQGLPNTPAVVHTMLDPAGVLEKLQPQAAPRFFGIASKFKTYWPLAVSIASAFVGLNSVVDHMPLKAGI